jgi:phosphoribosylanthranilate isomerase
VSETSTRVKICGITNREDAEAAVDDGADALGFIFVPESPRCVTSFREVFELLARIPPLVSRVAVCRTPGEIPADWRDRLDAIQYYEPSPVGAFAGKRTIRAFQMRDQQSIETIATELTLFRPDAMLLDTYRADRLGGSGERFDWHLARSARDRFDMPLIMAGGLTPENVTDAVRQVRPFAVDVSSGVERAPGRKDHGELHAFMEAVRDA